MGAAAKAVLRGTFVMTVAYIRKNGSQINNPILHLKGIEKEELTQTEVGRRKEIKKIRE